MMVFISGTKLSVYTAQDLKYLFATALADIVCWCF